VTVEARSVREQELLDLGRRRDRELVEGVVAGVGDPVTSAWKSSPLQEARYWASAVSCEWPSKSMICRRASGVVAALRNSSAVPASNGSRPRARECLYRF
jgi:hypothetical protein